MNIPSALHIRGSYDLKPQSHDTDSTMYIKALSYTYFTGLLGHENSQYHICYRSRNGYVATFNNYTSLWVSKLWAEIPISTLNSDYVALSHSVGYLITLTSLTNEVIAKLGSDSDKLEFV